MTQAKKPPKWYGRPWGKYTHSEWDEAVAKGRAVIIANWGRTGSLGSYTEFAEAVGILDWPRQGQWEDHHRAQVGRLLGDIGVQEWLHDRPMLSALVVHKDDGRPGDTWFALMKELNPSARDLDKAWLDQVKACWAYDWNA